MARRKLFSSIEALEARIAPANLSIFHPLLDLMPSAGKTSQTIDLGAMLDSDPTAGYRTHVEFTTNFDTDPNTPGLQAGKIVLELFDDKAPLTVQNFVSYVNNANARGDFDGVFFHRLVAGFVLQTGGYEATTPGTHIPVSETVHNEYNPADPERSNTVGTVAMAKVGSDPNSATSEWFFNLGDNSSNLNTQNGGFTVFGKVVSGMDVVNAIASLPTSTAANGSPSPVQNGYDAASSAAAPKPSQLVSFTAAKVLTPKNSTIADASYSVSVTDLEGHSTDLLSTKITGDNLKLSYKPGGSGIALVNVTVTSKSDPNAAPLVEQFEVNLEPNLVTHSSADTLPVVTAAGDTGVGTIKLVNTGGGSATGTVDVKYYLSHVDGYSTTETNQDGSPKALGPDPTGTIVDSSDLLVGSLLGQSINIAGGKNALLNVNLHIPDDANMASGSYRLIAQVTESNGSTITESYTDDNVMTDGRVHAFYPGDPHTNLSALGAADNLPAVLLPGDSGLVKVGVGNSSSHLASGAVDVKVYLSLDTTPTNSTDGLDTMVDTLIGQITGQSLSLASGKSATLNVPVAIPKTLSMQEGYYRVFAQITSADGVSQIQELTPTDNTTAGNYHLLQHDFGTFTLSGTLLGTVSRKDAVLTYTDANSHDVQLHVSGPGFGTAALTGTSGVSVALEGTTLSSKFSVTAPAGVRPILQDVIVGQASGTAIGTLSLANVDWSGVISAAGGAKSILLGNTSGTDDHYLGIGTSKTAAKLHPVVQLGDVTDLSADSLLPLASLMAKSWTDTNAAAEQVNLVGVTAFHVAGNFEANLDISAAVPSATPLVKTFAVDGVLKDAVVRIAGNVTSATLGALHDSDLLVGTDVVPAALQDYNFPVRSIAKIVINGGVAGETASLTNSVIAAGRLGTVILNGQVADGDSTGKFGFIADKITSYRHGAAVPLKNLDAAGTYDVTGNYDVTLLA